MGFQRRAVRTVSDYLQGVRSGKFAPGVQHHAKPLVLEQTSDKYTVIAGRGPFAGIGMGEVGLNYKPVRGKSSRNELLFGKVGQSYEQGHRTEPGIQCAMSCQH